jgi:two-component sensor histidine kinase
MNLAPVRLNIDKVIPCGLLVNELITNALKHAFPDGRSGELRVELQELENGQGCRLRVADDGVGLPPDFDLKQVPSLGLRLATDLARQLGGGLKIGAGPGAVFEVEFKAIGQ